MCKKKKEKRIIAFENRWDERKRELYGASFDGG